MEDRPVRHNGTVEIHFVCAKCEASKILTVSGSKRLVKRFLKGIGCIYPCGVNGCNGNVLRR